MIEAKNITKNFGTFNVLSDISLSVKRGEIYGLIGYNGVGKTTLLKLLSGIYRPDDGMAMIAGQPVYENPGVKNRCFFMTEEASFFQQSSLNRMRDFYAGYYPRWSDTTFKGLTDWFGVDPSMKISRFSKGMQRQASMILAFSTRPEYLFLDEAFDGLDYSMRRQVREMFRYYAREKNAAILVTSHNLSELEELADQIGMLHDGRLAFDGSTEKMKRSGKVCEFTYMDTVNAPDIKNSQLLERLESADEMATAGRYRCILSGTEEEMRRILMEAGAEDIRMRELSLEDFFRKERNERDADWKKIFK